MFSEFEFTLNFKMSNNLLSVEVPTVTVDLLSPNSSMTSSPNSSLTSPRSRPRLSFDESSLIKQQEEKKKNQNELNTVTTISSNTILPLRIGCDPEVLRRASTPGVISCRGHEESMEYQSRPSLYSNSSPHPSLQEDMCSEIIRLDSVSVQRDRSFSQSGEEKEDRPKTPPRLRTIVSVFQVGRLSYDQENYEGWHTYNYYNSFSEFKTMGK